MSYTRVRLIFIATIVVVGIFFALYFYQKSADTQPSLDRKIPSTSADMSRDAWESVLQKHEDIVKELRANPEDFLLWTQLGAYRQILGDIEGAEEAWQYVTRINVNSNVAYANLGFLYMTYKKDYQKAEQYFLEALSRNNTDTNTYRSLYELYLYRYKQDTSAAEDILKEGIKNNTEAIDLHTLLARYYREKGRIAEAKEQYGVTIDIAQQTSNAAVENALTEERDAF